MMSEKVHELKVLLGRYAEELQQFSERAGPAESLAYQPLHLTAIQLAIEIRVSYRSPKALPFLDEPAVAFLDGNIRQCRRG